MALELAYEMACVADQIKLILLGRSELPPRSTWESQAQIWDERHQQMFQRIRDIERLGAEVFTVQADVTDIAAMRSALAMISERYGPLKGVIHAAGIAGGGVIALKTEQDTTAVLAPKVQGTWVLDQLLGEMSLDFFVLCSSVNALLHEPGQVDYCAANAFLDAFAHYRSSKGRALTISINWDRWHNTGMARQLHSLSQKTHSTPAGISPQGGRKAFCRVLASAQPQVIVSARVFPPVEQAQQAIPEKPAEQTTATTTGDSEISQTRPFLSKAYTTPRNETERHLTGIWQQVMGIVPIGVDDNFFELGGHSVIALRIASQVHTLLGQELPLQTLLEHPTIGEQAAILLQKTGQAAGSPGVPLVPVSRAAYRAELSEQGEIISSAVIRQRLNQEKG
jgi:NAD(P)-dependent dehydrogenase (short-subunit alcohol dehydrogenase family)